MFTGLVTDLGRIDRRLSAGTNTTFRISTAYDTDDLSLGESIAINGACLTVTAIGDATFDIDASPETLRRTTLGDCRPGDTVHLERALRLADRLGGHLVLGHVDGVGTVTTRSREKNAWLLQIEAPQTVQPYLIEKGSITVDGVSLTINSVDGARFGLAIIPHTADKTMLADYQPGRQVNLEADMIGKYVEKFVHSAAPGLTLDDLTRAGFE